MPRRVRNVSSLPVTVFDESGAHGTTVAFAAGSTVSIAGSNLVEQLTEADAVGGNLTFAAVIDYIDIVNRDAANAGVFTVNGIAITVPPSMVLTPTQVVGVASAVVAVAGSTSYIVTRRS